MRVVLLALLPLALAGCQPRERHPFEPGRSGPEQPGLEALRARAEAGNGSAEFQATFLRHFLTGEYDEAARWLRRAAALGSERAARDLAFYEAWEEGR